MKSLQDIENFGTIDAESDDILIDVFEDHEAYQHLISFKKFLIIGRKGTGKTAIFKKMLTLDKETNLTFGHTFMDYPWHYHDAQKSQGVPEHEKYVNSWKYLLLITLSKIILNYDMSLPFDNTEESMEILEKLEKFVIDSYGSRDPDLTQLFTPSRKIKIKPYLRISVIPGVESGINPETIGVDMLPRIFSEVNKSLSHYVLSSLNPNNNYYILFDQLDLGFEPNSPEYSNRIIGLILASRDMNLLAKQYGKSFYSVIFLRDDIFDGLHFDDKSKITNNYVSTIEWDTPRTEKTLKQLMEKRFTALLSENNETVEWDNVFDEVHQMTGKQRKYQHIIDRTFLRPRDMIQFCNEILTQYKSRLKSKTGYDEEKDLFLNVDVNMAKGEYSNYFLGELDDEVFKHIPTYRNYFEIFKTIGFLQFTKKDFKEAFEKRKDLVPEIMEPMQILKELFEFSIIGFYRAGGGGYGGAGYVYKYLDRRSQFDLSAESFRIHPALMEVLGLKKYSRTSE